MPEAGFYVFPKVTGLMQRMGFHDVEEFRKATLNETGVSFCGRHHFGRPLEGETDFYIRMAFSGIGKDNLQEGMNLFRNWVDSNIK